jgi:glycine cleavage system H lipoate-binding protein
MYTRTHEILRPRVRTEAPEPSTSGASDEFVFVRIGLADRAFDEIGDVKAIAAVAAAGSRLRRDENVCVLSWEGFKRTASDELYHAVWANASGDRRFAAPFACEVVEINASALADPYGVVCGTEKGWIAELRVTRAALQSAVRDGDLLSEEKYAERTPRRAARTREAPRKKSDFCHSCLVKTDESLVSASSFRNFSRSKRPGARHFPTHARPPCPSPPPPPSSSRCPFTRVSPAPRLRSPRA